MMMADDLQSCEQAGWKLCYFRVRRSHLLSGSKFYKVERTATVFDPCS